MRLFIAGIIALTVITYLVRFISDITREKKCTATTSGLFLYSNQYVDTRGFGRCVPYWYPVYEFMVNNQTFDVEISKKMTNSYPDRKEVEVKYNPSDPMICFIETYRGKVVSKHASSENTDE